MNTAYGAENESLLAGYPFLPMQVVLVHAHPGVTACLREMYRGASQPPKMDTIRIE